MSANKLKWHPDKINVLFVQKFVTQELWPRLVLKGVVLHLEDQVCILGVLLDPVLFLDAQMLAMAWRAYHQFWLVHQLHLFLDWADQFMVIYALIISKLDYCNTLYMELPVKNDSQIVTGSHKAGLGCWLESSFVTLLYPYYIAVICYLYVSEHIWKCCWWSFLQFGTQVLEESFWRILSLSLSLHVSAHLVNSSQKAQLHISSPMELQLAANCGKARPSLLWCHVSEMPFQWR